MLSWDPGDESLRVESPSLLEQSTALRDDLFDVTEVHDVWRQHRDTRAVVHEVVPTEELGTEIASILPSIATRHAGAITIRRARRSLCDFMRAFEAWSATCAPQTRCPGSWARRVIREPHPRMPRHHKNARRMRSPRSAVTTLTR